MENVEGNNFFKKAKNKASGILKNNDRLKQLLNVSAEKLSEINVDNFKKSGFVGRIKVLSRLVMAYKRGDYRNVDFKSILLMVAGLVYFITPLDLIPDFIPITGLVDDFTVILWVYNRVQQEIDKFVEWENSLENG